MIPVTPFHVRLEHLRYRDFVSRAALARKLHISAAAVGRWERGETQPSLEALVKLARIFKVSADYLLGLTDKEETILDYEHDCKRR